MFFYTFIYVNNNLCFSFSLVIHIRLSFLPNRDSLDEGSDVSPNNRENALYPAIKKTNRD